MKQSFSAIGTSFAWGIHTVPIQLFSGARFSSSMSAKSLLIPLLPYDGCLMIRRTVCDDSLWPMAFLSRSPSTIFNEEGLEVVTQWAADITHFGWMSEPPQKEKPELTRRREACHFHSHSVACWPFTILTPTDESPLEPHGVLSIPFCPQVPRGGGVVGGPGVVVVTVIAQSCQPVFTTE